jgi:hypothetical protein
MPLGLPNLTRLISCNALAKMSHVGQVGLINNLQSKFSAYFWGPLRTVPPCGAWVEFMPMYLP